MKFEVIRSNRRTMGAEIKGGKLIVRVPLLATNKEINRFIEQHKKWFETHLAKAEKREKAKEGCHKLTQDEIVLEKYMDATGKYIALALTPNAPRYFMLEYSENKETHEPAWVIGELRLNNGDVEHRFIDAVDNMRLTWFAGYILGMLDAEEEK